MEDIDFDQLNLLEREQYLKALEQVETSKITLDDWKKYISAMREAVEETLVKEEEYIYSPILPFLKRPNPKYVEAKIRLKHYLIFEKFFTRAEQAKKVLEEYRKRLKG